MYKEEFIKAIDRTDLDMGHPFYENGSDERNDIELSSIEGSSIEIDEVINILNNLKNSGANRVYIQEDCDHHGYQFYGVKLIKLK